MEMADFVCPKGKFDNCKGITQNIPRAILYLFTLLVKVFVQRGSELKECMATTKGVKGKTPKNPKWDEMFLFRYYIFCIFFHFARLFFILIVSYEM